MAKIKLKTLSRGSSHPKHDIATYRYGVCKNENLNEHIVVIEQTELSFPSVTNTIEELVTYIVQTDPALQEIPLSQIIWFEHYPKSIRTDWLYNFSKVSFDEKNEEDTGFFAWLKRTLGFRKDGRGVAYPVWDPLSEAEFTFLQNSFNLS